MVSSLEQEIQEIKDDVQSLLMKMMEFQNKYDEQLINCSIGEAMFNIGWAENRLNELQYELD